VYSRVALSPATVGRPASSIDVQAGMVGINVPIPVAYYSFGGW
jgi:hypothetical protein